MFLFVAPFSTDSVFITCDRNLDMRFVLILNYKHVRTAGLRVLYEIMDRPRFTLFFGRFCILCKPGYDAIFCPLKLYAIVVTKEPVKNAMRELFF